LYNITVYIEGTCSSKALNTQLLHILSTSVHNSAITLIAIVSYCKLLVRTIKVIWEQFNVTYIPHSNAIKTEVYGMKVTALGWFIYRKIKEIIRLEPASFCRYESISKTGMYTPLKKHVFDVVVTELQTLH